MFGYRGLYSTTLFRFQRAVQCREIRQSLQRLPKEGNDSQTSTHGLQRPRAKVYSLKFTLVYKSELQPIIFTWMCSRLTGQVPYQDFTWVSQSLAHLEKFIE